MQFSAEQIATLVQGTIEGNANTVVNAIGKIEEGKIGDICFLANKKYENFIYETKASIVLVNQDFEAKKKIDATLIRVKDAYAAFALLLQTYQTIIGNKHKQGVEKESHIAATASVGEGTYIGAFTYIDQHASIGNHSQIYPHCYIGENVKIGNNVIIYPGVKIYHNTIIGNDVIIHAGTVIGSDGFGFAHVNGTFQKIPQLGNVIVENNVEIGANCTIDRATIGSTIIRAGAKLDNLIQVAHNVEIGAHTVIAAQAGISGSTRIGSGAMIGGQAGIVGHIQIADGCKINAQSGVSKSLKTKGSSVTGSPAFDYHSALKSQAVFKLLPELLKKIESLERTIQNNNKINHS